MYTIAILGHGKVGRALEQIYRESVFDQPLIKDIHIDNFTEDIDILNICIPYSDDFITIVAEQMERVKPKLTIIHSTVEPYTTIKLKRKTKMLIVHSPIRGLHSNLYKSIKTFVKYIGADNSKDGNMAKDHFKELGWKRSKVFSPSIVTEVNKLISTTYYGICIAVTDYISDICEEFKIPFETFRHFNTTYNRGYRRFRMKNVNRPELNPPNGPIQGTCIVPNAKILQKHVDHKLIQALLEVGENKKIKVADKLE